MSSATATLEAPQATNIDTAAGLLVSQTTPAVKDSSEITEEGLVAPPQDAAKPRARKDRSLSEESWEQQTDDTNTIPHKVEPEGRVLQRRPIVLRPEITQEARQWLTGDLELINQRAMLLCTEQAKRMHVRVSGLQLSVKRSWEGEFRELVLRVFVEANFAQALALWDSIGEAIQRWGTKQPPKIRRLLEEQYAVFVEHVGL